MVDEASALRALARLLDALGIRWVLAGALAANRYRSTVSSKITFDEEYVHTWAEFWEVTDLWQRTRTLSKP